MFYLQLRWGGQDISQFAQVLREKKNNLPYEVIKLSKLQACYSLITQNQNLLTVHNYVLRTLMNNSASEGFMELWSLSQEAVGQDEPWNLINITHLHPAF